MEILLKDYLTEKPVLETERLILRKYTPDDAGDLKEWLSDPDLYTYWGRDASKGEQNPETLFIDPRPHVVRKPSRDFCWAMVLKKNNKLIGELQIFNIENDRMAKVAYRLSKQYWSHGLTTEALREAVRFCFENTELQKLYTDVDIRNIASCRILEKCGFIKEGLIRQGKMGLTYCDYYLYGMLRSDYTSK